MTKKIKNRLHGYHVNSKYWQTYKSKLPPVSNTLFEIAVGMILGDATMYYVSHEAYIKFEQGWKQKPFLDHLFEVFCRYCFMQQPSPRYTRDHTLKSYWFKTFSFPDFTKVFLLFYEKNEEKKTTRWKKGVKSGLVLHHLTPLGFAYWIMCDGSLQKDGKTLILHTQSFSFQENIMLSNELNQKFGLASHVIVHKHKYYVIEIPKQNYDLLYNLVSKYMIPSMFYKIEKKSLIQANDIV